MSLRAKFAAIVLLLLIAPIIAAGAPPPFGDLQAIANEWWPLGAIRALWAAHTYEIDRVVQSNGKPLAIIAVGVSTSLIAPKVHRALGQILIVAGCAITLSLLGA